MPRRSARLAAKPRVNYAAMAGKVSRRRAPKTKKAITKLVKNVVRGQAETKMTAWYSGSTNPSGVGARATWAIEPHNAQITSNTTDIMRLVPIVAVGTGDNQRIGERITPVGLRVDGVLSINYTNILSQTAPQDFVCVLYVLQHKSLKTYNSLQTGPNDFTQLLLTGEGDTVAFTGNPYHATLPVADQYYKLCAKKVIKLRYAGAQITPAGSSPPGGSALLSVANAHTWSAPYSFNLKKHLPKVLKYQESNVTSGQTGDPLNSSIFMCVGYYRMDQQTPGDAAYISNSYVSKLTYKDL